MDIKTDMQPDKKFDSKTTGNVKIDPNAPIIVKIKITHLIQL